MKTVLVVPCYNESQRLDFKTFAAAVGPELQILFVDDGSKDSSVESLRSHFHNNPYVTILPLAQNGGKARAVQLGMLHLLENKEKFQADWWGFWDADLATPLSELDLFSRYQKDFAPDAQAVFGSRLYRLGSKIKRSALRHYLGRGFATVVSHALQVEAYDTQCGAKLFRPSIAQKAFGESFISAWIFDIEILLRIGQENVVEYPLTIWEDIPGSKVKIGREILRVLRDILLIREKYVN